MKRSIYKNLPYLLLVIAIAAVCAGLDGFLSIFMMRTIDAVTSGSRELFKEYVIKLEQQVFLFEDTVRNNITLYKNLRGRDKCCHREGRIKGFCFRIS